MAKKHHPHSHQTEEIRGAKLSGPHGVSGDEKVQLPSGTEPLPASDNETTQSSSETPSETPSESSSDSSSDSLSQSSSGD